MEVASDERGRLLILQVEKEGSTYVLGNIYAPTQECLEEQIQLIDSLEDEISKLNPQNIIIGGDFNICMDWNLDRSTNSVSTPSHASQAWSNYRARIGALCESLELFDIWRTLHP